MIHPEGDRFRSDADWYLIEDTKRPIDKTRDRIAPGTEYLNANGHYCLFVDGAIRLVWDVFYTPKRKDAIVYSTIILPMPPRAEPGWCYSVDGDGCVKYVEVSTARGKPYKTYQGALNYSQEITQELYYDLYQYTAEEEAQNDAARNEAELREQQNRKQSKR